MLMSWVRTSVAMIGFGFTIFEFFHDIHGLAPAERRTRRGFWDSRSSAPASATAISYDNCAVDQRERESCAFCVVSIACGFELCDQAFCFLPRLTLPRQKINNGIPPLLAITGASLRLADANSKSYELAVCCCTRHDATKTCA